MTSIGWEFYGMKFSILLTMLMSVLMSLSIVLGSRKPSRLTQIDTMAGDEGED